MRIALALAAALLLAPLPASAAAAAAAEPPAAAGRPPSSARAAELDSLFAALKAVTGRKPMRASSRRAIQELWLDSGDAEVNRLMDYAIAAVNARAYTLAIDYLDSIVLRKPDYAEGWNKRATVYWLMGADDRRSTPSRSPTSSARSRSSRATGARSPAAA